MVVKSENRKPVFAPIKNKSRTLSKRGLSDKLSAYIAANSSSVREMLSDSSSTVLNALL